uniref:peptide-methionine (S)-S-oxide reductase n=1 Tax=Schistocephalus solidus TaxID=70667 RepID=A0A0X3P999_SCHSO
MASTVATHSVLGTPMNPPFPAGHESVMFGMGCFWGAERKFWEIPNIYTTQVGYAGGNTENPTYKDVCKGDTNHAEVVRVVFNPRKTPFSELLKVFWESHDPTQFNRQGNDVGTQYRSVIFTSTEEQLASSLTSRDAYQSALGHAQPITTEIRMDSTFTPAEDYHQQYLNKNPHGYCGLQGTGVTCPKW